MVIYGWFSHLKIVNFHSYVSLPEGRFSSHISTCHVRLLYGLLVDWTSEFDALLQLWTHGERIGWPVGILQCKGKHPKFCWWTQCVFCGTLCFFFSTDSEKTPQLLLSPIVWWIHLKNPKEYCAGWLFSQINFTHPICFAGCMDYMM